MNGNGSQFAFLNESRLAAHALSAAPAWLWSADGRHILWTNAPGAAVFDAQSPAAAAALQFDAKHPAVTQIARLAGTLPAGGTPRLERLRGFGAGLGGALLCLCSRITPEGMEPAILVAATEATAKKLPLPERAQRLLKDLTRPAAVFSADGEPIAATPDAATRFGAARDLTGLGAEALAREAMLNGRAEGDVAGGPVTLIKLGAGATVTLLLAAAAPAATTAETPPANARPAAAEEHPRRFPFRFVWQMDADGRFALGVDDFVRLLGPSTAAVFDRPWAEIASRFKLDPKGEVAAALAAHDTWSGIVIDWPVDDDGERLPIEMSGLPVFDRDRKFEGFRGFGVCRATDRLDALARRRAQPPPLSPEPEPPGKVLPFRAQPAEKAPSLSPGEHNAFQELARELGERLKTPPVEDGPTSDDFGPESYARPAQPQPPAQSPDKSPAKSPAKSPTMPPRAAHDAHEGRPILDRLPVGILVYRLNNLLYANRAFLDWTGYESLPALAEAGGLDSLFIETRADAAQGRNGSKTLTISTVNGNQRPVEGRLFSVAWNEENALVLMINTQDTGDERQGRAAELSLRQMQAENLELAAILDTATDGVLILDRAGRILSGNRSAEALFGYDKAELCELSFGDLFAPESRRAVMDHLDRLARNGGPESFDPGREAIGRVRQGGLMPLMVTVGRIADGEKFCAVLRDLTASKRTEEELINARHDAERALTAKSEFLAKISHDVRTPLNAIIGFSEVMLDERFGPVGNERYRQYLKDIQSSGGQLVTLINDLLDLSKIEAGRIELSFVSVSLNDLVQQCVAYMQEQANRERVIIRTSLPPGVPQIVADARSVRQIALNLVSNAIKFASAGGQVIVSTALTDGHEVVLRVRHTGAGMSDKELESALEPFRQLATTPRWDVHGTGLGLPITKALAQANHARFRITGRASDGTLMEVAFPATRVLAQ